MMRLLSPRNAIRYSVNADYNFLASAQKLFGYNSNISNNNDGSIVQSKESLSSTTSQVKPNSGQKKQNTSKTSQSSSSEMRYSRSDLNHRTMSLVKKMKLADSSMSRVMRTDQLCQQLLKFPRTREIAVETGAISFLLRSRQRFGSDAALCDKTNQALSLLGYSPPLKGNGINILSIDGGGTRGLVAVEVIERLEHLLNGRRINDVFDYVVGVSTGAVLAVLIAGLRLPFSEIKQIYTQIAVLLFSQSRFAGTQSILWSGAYYDTEKWVKFLREIIGETQLIDFASSPEYPRIGIVTSLVNTPQLEAFVFRNYNYPPDQYSVNRGSCNQPVWKALQASGAAPFYFQEVIIDKYVHQDGGVFVNNPTAVGLHECRRLWPGSEVQCIVSVGTGRSNVFTQNLAHEAKAQFSSYQEIVKKMVDSATETESINTTMDDVMPSSSYFRFNPYLSEVFSLDENRPEKLSLMQHDSQLYCRKNLKKLQTCANKLNEKKSAHLKMANFVTERVRPRLDWLGLGV